MRMTNDIGCSYHFNGLVQDCSNSIALAMELLQSCAEPSICAQQKVEIPQFNSKMTTLTHYGVTMSYGDICMGQHCFRYWCLIVWWHQIISWNMLTLKDYWHPYQWNFAENMQERLEKIIIQKSSFKDFYTSARVQWVKEENNNWWLHLVPGPMPC